jgi:proline iminopeptidase
VIYGLSGLIAVCAIIVGGLIWRVSLQNATRSARAKIDPKVGVDELFKIDIGGIQQWIHARGVNRSDPVLLYLHGGPGTPMMAFENMFQNPLENHFIVVHWDQRGVGKTYRENPKLDYSTTVTYERMVKDASEVLDLLRKRYGKEKIIVLGHSWGSMLGLGLLEARPDGISAYVGAGQVVDVVENESVGYAATLAEAKKQNNPKAVRELEAIAPYPDSSGISDTPKINVLRDWQQALGFGISRRHRGNVTIALATFALRSPEYSLWDVVTFLDDGGGQRWPILSRENDAFKASTFGFTYRVPVFLLLGRYDWQVPSTIAEKWLAGIQAPFKRTIWFENSAHSPMIDEPELFSQILINDVRPLALKNSSVPVQK